jgi:hypothetical protein
VASCNPGPVHQSWPERLDSISGPLCQTPASRWDANLVEGVAPDTPERARHPGPVVQRVWQSGDEGAVTASNGASDFVEFRRNKRMGVVLKEAEVDSVTLVVADRVHRCGQTTIRGSSDVVRTSLSLFILFFRHTELR